MIDTDKHKYPIGSGRVSFQTHESYQKAVLAEYLLVKVSFDHLKNFKNDENVKTVKDMLFTIPT